MNTTGIDALPVDARTGLPVPWSSATTTTGRPDFTRIDATKAAEADQHHLCGVCGNPLGYWVAFLGTTETVAGGVFHDPPMHPDCARRSLQLCPHIADGRAVVRVGQHGARRAPQGWSLWITRGWKAAVVGGLVTFVPAPAKTVEVWVYDENRHLRRERQR